LAPVSTWGQPPPVTQPARSRRGRNNGGTATVRQRSGCLTKVLAIVGALAILAVVVGIATFGDKNDGTADDANRERSVTLFPGRPDAQESDQERNIGQPAVLGGMEAIVTRAAFQQSLNEFETDGYFVVEVTLRNTSGESQPYNEFDWRVQTDNGQVLDATLSTEATLNSGDLVDGGSVSGKIIFDAPTTGGFVIWKPNAFESDRGIWKIG
jgi:hypothetical protein